MKSIVQVRLDGTPEQTARLRRLQVAFAEVCNSIAPVVQQTRCWNRVALHHLLYRQLRERFPALGSQMVCNAIYSVSRSARVVLQHPASPWNVNKRGAAPLPHIRFADTAPVYFDRHTLSLKNGGLSMFTLDGRMRFEVRLSAVDEARFQHARLLEVVLTSDAQGYQLTFRFGDGEEQTDRPQNDQFPKYVLVLPPSQDNETFTTVAAHA
jgi:hypothetical protein